VPKAQAEQVLSLYRDKYFDLNVRHFHEKLGEDHQIGLSYTWVLIPASRLRSPIELGPRSATPELAERKMHKDSS
jgi:hypothetical protein